RRRRGLVGDRPRRRFHVFTRPGGQNMPAQQKFFLGTAAFLGALAVILGAFGAHGLENRVPPERLETFETGVRYHMYHAIAMLVVACAVPVLWKDPWAAAACWAWLVGILIFSGSLYTLT